jgi:NAD(P)-dependent dehydrogenase (short-subunit alcohol dehydrogenase family)
MVEYILYNPSLTYLEKTKRFFLSWIVQIDPNQVDWTKIFFENYELVEKSLKTNYFGTKELTEALIPILQCSNSPKIVNVSSSIGRLEV